MSLRGVAVLLLAGAGAGAGAAGAQRPGGAAPADSLALERTPCLGTCPAYRVVIDRAGRVRFASRSPGDTTRAVDSIAPAGFAYLLAEAERAGFRGLPPRIEYGDREWCPGYGTDHPGAVVTLYWAHSARSVVHDHGCYGAVGADYPGGRLRPLYALEAAIDSVAGARRWVRPAGRR